MYGVHYYRLGPLWEYDYFPVGDEESVSPTRRPEWCASSIYHHRDTERVPHIKCIMIYDTDGDNNTLLRGELLALIRIIKGRLSTVCFVDHYIAPVRISFFFTLSSC